MGQGLLDWERSGLVSIKLAGRQLRARGFLGLSRGAFNEAFAIYRERFSDILEEGKYMLKCK